MLKHKFLTSPPDVHEDLEEDIVDDGAHNVPNVHANGNGNQRPYHVFSVNEGENLGRYQDMGKCINTFYAVTNIFNF